MSDLNGPHGPEPDPEPVDTDNDLEDWWENDDVDDSITPAEQAVIDFIDSLFGDDDPASEDAEPEFPDLPVPDPSPPGDYPVPPAGGPVFA